MHFSALSNFQMGSSRYLETYTQLVDSQEFEMVFYLIYSDRVSVWVPNFNRESKCRHYRMNSAQVSQDAQEVLHRHDLFIFERKYMVED